MISRGTLRRVLLVIIVRNIIVSYALSSLLCNHFLSKIVLIINAFALVSFSVLANARIRCALKINWFLSPFPSGTICDRIFLNCDEYRCAVQSPNFPGLYPRHVTCHYLIKQTRYVPYARPLVSISQPNPLRFNVKANSALPSTGGGLTSPSLQVRVI